MRETGGDASFGVMRSGPVFLVSDVHLGAVPPGTEEAFRRWLRHVGESGSRLIINGDLFDFWFEYRKVVLGEHVRVLAMLADLVEAGVPVLIMGGNHDWWGGDYLRQRIGVDFRREPARIRVKGKSLLVAHGDGLGSGDLGYRILRLVLRGRFTRWLFRWLHPDLGMRIADRVSGTRAYLASGGDPGDSAGAIDVTGMSPRDLIEIGIAHIPEDRRAVGVASGLDIGANLCMKSYWKEPLSRRGVMSRSAVRALEEGLRADFDIRGGSRNLPVSILSGGNIQKVILARELSQNPAVVIAAYPTRGLDLGAVANVRDILIGQLETGTAVVLVSEDLDELLALSDRLLVMYEGRVVGEYGPDVTPRTILGAAMAGRPPT